MGTDGHLGNVGNVPLEKCKISIIYFVFTIGPLLLKAHFNSVPADILKDHVVHPFP